MSAMPVTYDQVIALVASLPDDRLQSVYDFTLFVKQQSTALTPETDLFGESAEEIEADEVIWQEKFSNSLDQLRVMAREAAEEYRAGRTESMESASFRRNV